MWRLPGLNRLRNRARIQVKRRNRTKLELKPIILSFNFIGTTKVMP